MPSSYSRRKLLKSSGAGVALTLAGCLSSLGDTSKSQQNVGLVLSSGGDDLRTAHVIVRTEDGDALLEESQEVPANEQFTTGPVLSVDLSMVITVTVDVETHGTVTQEWSLDDCEAGDILVNIGSKSKNIGSESWKPTIVNTCHYD